MNFPGKAKDEQFSGGIQADRFLGAVYLCYIARKWAIKVYPGQWFEAQEKTCAWLVDKKSTSVSLAFERRPTRRY
jgi:hypothetical protein